jgi:hypothetical protein
MAISLSSFRNGAVGFIGWLDEAGRTTGEAAESISTRGTDTTRDVSRLKRSKGVSRFADLDASTFATLCRNGYLEQAVLNKTAPSLVLKMPVRFEILARRASNKVRFGQFVEMELGSFGILSKGGTNLFGLQRAVCTDKRKNTRFNFGTI